MSIVKYQVSGLQFKLPKRPYTSEHRIQLREAQIEILDPGFRRGDGVGAFASPEPQPSFRRKPESSNPRVALFAPACCWMPAFAGMTRGKEMPRELPRA
jgi:hypothetical protein